MSGNKIRNTLLAVFILAGLTGLAMLAACNSNGQAPPHPDDGEVGIAGTTMVIYSTFASDFAKPIVEIFEETYGVTVELHIAGIGPTLARLRAEATNPRADVLWGVCLFTALPETDLFEDFISVNEPYMLPGQQNTQGSITRFTVNTGVILINKSLIGDIEIHGYACLLNPELRGQIAITYPTASNSPFNHLVSQLFAMGGGDPGAGWRFMERFIINVGGNILPNLDAVYMGVASGDFIVGLTHEEAALSYIGPGSTIKYVHAREGTIAASTGIAVVNGTGNREAAQTFIDFVTSGEIQAFIEANLHRRSARKDIPSTGAMVANAELNWIPTCAAYILENLDEWAERFWDLWMANN